MHLEKEALQENIYYYYGKVWDDMIYCSYRSLTLEGLVEDSRNWTLMQIF